MAKPEVHIRLIETIGKLQVFEVDDRLVRDHIDSDFIQGSNGQAREYVPDFEVWIGHAMILSGEVNETTHHEIEEWCDMRELHFSYDHAHSIAKNNEGKLRAARLRGDEDYIRKAMDKVRARCLKLQEDELAQDAGEFKEGDHPRDEGGKFSSGSGSGSGALQKELAQAVKNGRNINKLVNEKIASGIIPVEKKAEVVKDLQSVKEKQIQRTKRFGADPLVLAKINRERKAAARKQQRPFRNSPMSGSWAKDRYEKIMSLATFDPHAADREARLATVESIVREARKRGWKVRHTSSANGRVTSRYVEVPGVGEYRISDHHLPDTPKRAYSREISGGPRWAGEIVTDDWQHSKLSDYFDEMLGKEDGEDAQDFDTGGKALDAASAPEFTVHVTNDEAKRTQFSVGYTALAKNARERCGLCRYFKSPDSCERVAGEISPHGWCKLFSAKHAKDAVAGDAQITLPQVNAAITAKWPGWELHKGNGYFYLEGPDSEKAYSTSIPVNAINHLTLDRWLAEAKLIIDKVQRKDWTKDSAMNKAAGIMLVAPDGNVLLLRRSGYDYGGHWDWPGGSAEGGETPAETALRETAEETGQNIPEAALRPLDARRNGDLLFKTFAAGVPGKFAPELNGEHTGYCWASLNQLPQPLHPGVAATLRDRLTPTAKDMSPKDWQGLVSGLLKFLSEEADEPEHAEDVSLPFQTNMKADWKAEKINGKWYASGTAAGEYMHIKCGSEAEAKRKADQSNRAAREAIEENRKFMEERNREAQRLRAERAGKRGKQGSLFDSTADSRSNIGLDVHPAFTQPITQPIHITVPVTIVEKRGKEITRVTKHDSDGRIVEFERDEAHDQ